MGDFDHWNYRVLARDHTTLSGEVETYHEIIECYYDSAGSITAWAGDEGVRPGGDTVLDLIDDLQRMASAAMATLSKKGNPVVTVDDLPAEPSGGSHG